MSKFMRFSNASHIENVFETEEKMISFSKLLLDTANGVVKGRTTEEANEVIRAKFNNVLGINADSTSKEIRNAYRRHKIDVFEIIEEVVEELLQVGFGDNPFFEAYVEMKSNALGNKNSFYMPDNSTLVVSEYNGSSHELYRQRLGAGKEFQVTTRHYGVKIYEEFQRFQSGAIDWTAFVNKIYEAFDKKINDLIYNAFMSADEKLPTDLVIESQLNKATKKDLVKLIQMVRTATGKDVVVFGTEVGINTLADAIDEKWISERMRDERNTLGYVSQVGTIKCAVIPQVFANNDRDYMIDDTKLLIMPVGGDRPIKMFIEGDAQINEVTSSSTNYDKTVEFEYSQKLGVEIVLNMLFGVWKITD